MPHARHAQPRSTEGKRQPTGSSLLPDLRKEIDRECNRYGVSRSWIVAVAVAKHFDVYLPAAADYRAKPWKDSK